LDNFKKALNYAFLLLKYRPRAKQEIISRLRKKGYSISIIEKVLAYLEENKYLDDRSFAQAFASSRLSKGWGRKKIEFHLKKLGVPEEFIRETLDKKDFKEKIKELIEKKIKYYKGKNLYQKILKYLLAKGFDYHQILEELEKIGRQGRLDEDR
jgi:regulatory protein